MVASYAAKKNADISDTFNKCLLAAAVAASFEQMLTLFNLLFCCRSPLSSKHSCRVCLACCSRSRPRRRFCFSFSSQFLIHPAICRGAFVRCSIAKSISSSFVFLTDYELVCRDRWFFSSRGIKFRSPGIRHRAEETVNPMYACIRCFRQKQGKIMQDAIATGLSVNS